MEFQINIFYVNYFFPVRCSNNVFNYILQFKIKLILKLLIIFLLPQLTEVLGTSTHT